MEQNENRPALTAKDLERLFKAATENCEQPRVIVVSSKTAELIQELRPDLWREVENSKKEE